jgi:hypothetical protein
LVALAFSLAGADRGGGGIVRFHDDLTWWGSKVPFRVT